MTAVADPLSADADALAIAAAVRRGDVSAAEVVSAAIDRVQAADADHSFLVAERFERAAAEASRVPASAPLAGVPILMKDFLATVEGLPLTEGSRFVPGWVPDRDCEYVARLRRAGVVVLGSVTAAELAVLSSCESHRYGPTGNPAAPGRSTAGSSGGSGAAVAAGAVPAAHGSDAGGSIRMPAAACGVVGLKPTRGRNPLGPEHGDLGVGTWAEHVLTRSVRDSAAFLDATSGPASGDPYWAPPADGTFLESSGRPTRRLRIAISPTFPDGRSLHPESAAAIESVGRALADIGHELVEGNPRFDVAAAEEDFFTLFSAGLAARIAMWAGRLGREPAPEDLEPYTWYLVERGRSCSAPEIMAAITRLQRHSRDIAAFYDEVDVWLSPTLGLPSFPLGYLQTAADTSVDELLARDGVITAFTWPANMTGQPALSYPAGLNEEGDPLGVQFTGRFGEEQVLLALAASLDAAAPAEGVRSG